MTRRPVHVPGQSAPAPGTYEQINVFGTPTGIRVNVAHGQLKELLSTLEQNRSIFVTDPAYQQLIVALNARQITLERWEDMQPPQTPKEVQSVRRGVEYYKHLIASLESAIMGLNAFIVKLDQSQPQFAPCSHPPPREDHG